MARLDEEFAEPSLDALEDGIELVVADFGASWCGPCKRQDPVFKRVAETICEETPDDPVAFLMVDVDRNQPLAREQRVKSVPTTVILRKEDGLLWGTSWREKARFTGIVPYPKLLDEVSGYLNPPDG